VLYTYRCKTCMHAYSRSNTIAHRNKGGRCPECTSSDTKQVLSEGKMCEKREDGWYCVSSPEYQKTKFKNAIKAEEYENE